MIKCQLCGRASSETHRIRDRKIVCQVCTGEKKPGPVEADARALWAVRVLDAYDPTWGMGITGIRHFCVSFGLGGKIMPRAKTAEAARIAAAEALVAAHPELDPDAPRGAPASWLVEGLREASSEAERRPELAQRVADHPSGFLPERGAPETFACVRCGNTVYRANYLCATCSND